MRVPGQGASRRAFLFAFPAWVQPTSVDRLNVSKLTTTGSAAFLRTINRPRCAVCAQEKEYRMSIASRPIERTLGQD